jgi:hypothetical protein
LDENIKHIIPDSSARRRDSAAGAIPPICTNFDTLKTWVPAFAGTTIKRYGASFAPGSVTSTTTGTSIP